MKQTITKPTVNGMLKTEDHLHYPKLFRIFAVPNKGELPFEGFG